MVLFGLAPAAARGARGPPAPRPSQRPGKAARCRPGDGGLVSCRLRAALDKLCHALDCQPGDLLEYRPDEEA